MHQPPDRGKPSHAPPKTAAAKRGQSAKAAPAPLRPAQAPPEQDVTLRGIFANSAEPGAAKRVLRLVHRVLRRGGTIDDGRNPAVAVINQVPRLSRRHFRVERQLGTGAFGAVHLASVRRPQRVLSAPSYVALKELQASSSRTARRAELKFERDAHAAVCPHPHIAMLYGTVRSPRHPLTRSVLALEHVGGGSLRENTDRYSRPVHVPVALEITLQSATALEHMHARGVANRDLKQENIVLAETFGPTKGANVAKVIDFGLALRFDPDVPLSCVTTDTSGTAAYMTPNALVGFPHDMAKGDVYALGAMLYELLSTAYPFDGAETCDKAWDRAVYRRKNQPLSFTAKAWESVNEHTKDAVRQMLAPEDENRPTASMAAALLRKSM